MSRVFVCLVALILISAPPIAPRAQIQGGGVPGVAVPRMPPRDAPAKTGTSRIRGRVIAADNGQALPRVRVRISAPELRESRTTTTDTNGLYEFSDLPAGRYTLFASKNGYVSLAYGQRRPLEPGRPIELADNQLADRLDFSLPRGGVITGRVFDEFGEPIANAQVQAMPSRMMNGQRQPMPAGPPSMTPDTGEFRLWGLTPGDYYVLVTVRSMGFMENTDDRSGYSPTYYPSTTNAAEAQPVTVAVGQTSAGVDIVMSSTRTASISGTAIDSKGQPQRNGSVMAMARGRLGMFGGPAAGGPIRPDGTFIVRGLAPGEYTLRANVPPSAPGVPPEMLMTTLTVSGDVTGVVLAPVRPVKVTGRITLDPPSTSLQPSMVRVMAAPASPDTFFFGPPGGPPIVNDDFTFELQSMPGPVLIRATPSIPANVDWRIKAVRLNDADITDSEIELVSGRDVDGVEIILTNRVQVVSGLVTNARGEPVHDFTVIVFAQDRERWRPNTRFIATGRPDQDGRFKVQSLPAGEYYAAAVDYPRAGTRVGSRLSRWASLKGREVLPWRSRDESARFEARDGTVRN